MPLVKREQDRRSDSKTPRADAWQVMRMLHPELFDAARQGRHSQCGHEPGVSSLHDAVLAHHLLTESLHAAVCTIVDTRETLKVLLVTDIGRDLDDALALLALLPYCRAGDCQVPASPSRLSLRCVQNRRTTI